jgi:hypothetical protein
MKTLMKSDLVKDAEVFYRSANPEENVNYVMNVERKIGGIMSENVKNDGDDGNNSLKIIPLKIFCSISEWIT